MNPSRSSLQAIIEGCGLALTAEQYDRLWAYHRMLRGANEALNLTRIHNFENMVLKHYVDSLLVLRFVDPPGPLLDMGTGPGLPGIPLKIARPDLPMVLAEPRGARVEFLLSVVERLGLQGVEVFGGKVGPKFDRKVGAVITRAVTSVSETLERVRNCLDPEGLMILMKGPGCDVEVAEAASDPSGTRFRLRDDHAYAIPGTPHDRRLLVYERQAVASASPSGPETETEAEKYDGPVREVTSESNATFKHCHELLGGRGIRKQGRALLAGTRQVDEVLARHPGSVEAWLTDSAGPPPPAPGLTWVRLADPLFRELDASGTHAPLLVVRVPAMPAWSDADGEWPEGCTLFVPFQDPENVGAVLRSAAAFGAARAVLLREAAHPFHPKSARAAGPALFQIPLLVGPSVRDLRSRSRPLIALATDGEDLAAGPFPPSFGLVPGVEGPGLPDHLRGGPRLRVPIDPGVESLNAATATAVALYVWSRGRRPGTPPFS